MPYLKVNGKEIDLLEIGLNLIETNHAQGFDKADKELLKNLILKVIDIKDEATRRVICNCYGKDKIFSNKDEAIKFYQEGYYASEGAEQARYACILEQLHSGKKYCTDKY